MIVSKITTHEQALKCSEIMSNLSKFSNQELVDKCKFAIEHYGGNVPVENFTMQTSYTEVQFENLDNQVYHGIIFIDFSWWYANEEYMLRIDIFDDEVYAYNMDTNKMIIKNLSIDEFLK